MEEFREAWASGAYTTESVDGTAQLNANALGKVQMIEVMLDLQYEDLVKE